MNIPKSLEKKSNFPNLRVVLVETSHPGNIGAVARAMKNMGLQQLVLVKPLQFPHVEATARASGADDILAAAQVVDDLNQALQDCILVVGASARPRGVSAPTLNPRQAAAMVLEASHQGTVALVFGRERCGLYNDEMDRCHYQLYIPTDPACPSLNLAAAVLLVAYEIHMLALDSREDEPWETHGWVHHLDQPASAQDLEGFYNHLQTVLLATGFLNPDNPRHIMRRLRQLFNRARPNHREVNILRGILTAIQDHWKRL